MVNYFIQVMAGMTVAWLIYRLAMRNQAAAKYNRFFLLGGLSLPFILPFVPLSASTVSVAEPILLPEITVNQSASSFVSNEQAPWLLYMYFGGLLSMLIYHLSGLAYYLQAIQKAQKSASERGVYTLAQANMPFSFLGRIFLPADLSKDEQDVIVAHEQFHIERKHSIDVIFGIAAQSVLWFFPLLPFYLRDLRREHEFEVDQLMLGRTTFHDYADMLLQFNLKPIHHRLFHSFSSPNLKQRIIMMTKNQKQNAWKLMLFIPLLLSLIYLNACNKQQSEVGSNPASLKMVEVDVPPQFVDCDEGAEKEAAQKCFQEGLVKYLQENMKYPEKARQESVEGWIMVQITIDLDGNLESPEVIKSEINTDDATFSDMLEMAALEVFTNFPEMRPAQKDGKATPVEYVVPIVFKLPAKEESN